MVDVTPSALRIGALHLVRDALYDAFALQLRIYREIAGITQPLSVHAQHTRAHGMESARPYIVSAASEFALDALLHLVCGFVGESDRKDIVGRHSRLHQRADARGEHSGLAAARSRNDEYGTVAVLDGFHLFRIESEITHVFILAQSASDFNAKRPYRAGILRVSRLCPASSRNAFYLSAGGIYCIKLLSPDIAI